MRDQVFVSYSHRDARWLEELKIHLAPFERHCGLSVWSDHRISAGSIWREEIETALQRARVAVLLVSPHFLASEFIAQHELPPLLEAARNDGATILWIPVSNSAYQVTEIGDYQAAIDPTRPLDCMSGPSERNKAYVRICCMIQKASSGNQAEETQSSFPPGAAHRSKTRPRHTDPQARNVSAGDGGVAVGGDVHGDIRIGGDHPAKRKRRST